ncbi:MAG: C39 family peptidase [Dehalococcoidales bacterium]|nr:C39 family peptidase [Dehalococcoidales bacterium]
MCAVFVVLLGTIASNNYNTSSQYPATAESTGERVASVKELLPVSSKQLTVPYVEQGNTNWCFEASLSMVLRYYGIDVTAASIAADIGESEDDGISFLDMFLGPVDSYLLRWPEFQAQHRLGNWGFARYADTIHKGIPVVVSTFGFPGHTLVVVGYSEESEGRYLYVHDPSGFYSKLRWGDNGVRYVKVNWSLFSQSNWTQLTLSPVHSPRQNSTNHE